MNAHKPQRHASHSECNPCLYRRKKEEEGKEQMDLSGLHRSTHIASDSFFGTAVSMATPADPRGENVFFDLCKFWALKNF